jgi:hypothetical protein
MPLGQYLSSFSPPEGTLGIYGARQGLDRWVRVGIWLLMF